MFGRSSKRQVETDKINLNLQAAVASPFAWNQKPWEFYVVTRTDVLNQLCRTRPYASCAASAPAAILACYRTSDLRNADYAQMCCENILLEAVELDLGAVWVGIAPIEAEMDAVAKVLDMPEHLKAFAIIPLGYPEITAPVQDRYDEKRIYYIG